MSSQTESIVVEASEIKTCVKKFFNLKDDDNFVIYKLNSRPASDELIGYLGEYQKVAVAIKLNGEDKIMNLFIKSKKKDKELDELKFFYREFNTYNKIFSQYTHREDDDAFLSKYLLATKESLFFEDMCVKGFRMTDPRESLDDVHCLAALKQIGKLHAESLILEERKSIENKRPYRLEEEYDDFLNKYGYIYEGWYCHGVNAGLEAAKLSQNMPKNVDFPLFAKRWHEFFKNTLELFKPSKTSRNVICHRDLWSNNLMFRYDENGKLAQCIIVDFQSTGCTIPAGDVMSFIYLNVNDERRHDNLEKYLQGYYNSLGNELKQNGFDVEKLIPWEEFRTSCETYKSLAMVQCVILQQLGLIDGKQAKNIFKNPEDSYRLMYISRSDLIVKLITTDPIYKKSFMFTIDELIKMCLKSELK
ncbi:uncharacterized protein LOC143916044 [Arctopsyche grandis]|uniref:uncharacterized protein LOC143916044 n=1 Tax=Arctopsyche grandis TaxID=121162 RepID=UPI00406D7AC2